MLIGNKSNSNVNNVNNDNNDDGRWVHIDPCEAAVDEPLIYQSWGKNITYITAYDFNRAVAQDITALYTSDAVEIVQQRRHNDGINQTYINEVLTEASANLTSFVNEVKHLQQQRLGQ